jgi:hypothetical protein
MYFERKTANEAMQRTRDGTSPTGFKSLSIPQQPHLALQEEQISTRKSFDQFPNTKPTIPDRSRASMDSARPCSHPEQPHEVATLGVRPRTSSDLVRPMPTLPEKTVERNDSTTSTIAVIDVPRLARRFHANHVYIRRQPERHQSLPSELPYLQSQTLLTDDLADWIVPASAQSEKLKSTEWDSRTAVPSPSTPIIPNSVVTRDPVDTPQTTRTEPSDHSMTPGAIMPTPVVSEVWKIDLGGGTLGTMIPTPTKSRHGDDETSALLPTSTTETDDGSMTPDTVVTRPALSSNDDDGPTETSQESRILLNNDSTTPNDTESTPIISVNSNDNEPIEKPCHEQQNPSPVDSHQAAPLSSNTTDRDCAASIRSHLSSIIRKPLPAAARISPTVDIAKPAAHTNASSPCQSSFVLVAQPSYDQAGIDILFARPSTDEPMATNSEPTPPQEQTCVGIGKEDADAHVEKEQIAQVPTESSIANSKSTYPGYQYIAPSVVPIAAEKSSIASSESADPESPYVANHETSSTVPMPIELPAERVRPNSSDAPIAVKPMSAQAKRRAAHQRRMELAFGGS